jgi:beta-glucanase (GH16 family)
MMTGASSWLRICLLLAPLALACGGRHTTETGGGETNWLRACTTPADCHSSDCICGSCTLACSDSASCSAGPPGSTCAVTGSSALTAMCGAAPLPAGACLPPCGNGCASGTVCVADHCVPVHGTAAPDAGDAAITDGSAAVDRTEGAPDSDGTVGPADAMDSMGPEASQDSSDASTSTCPPGVAGHCSGATYAAYPGFTLKLVEDFDEPIDLASDPVWTYSDGFGDNRYTRYKKDAISFAGGKMIITATNDGVVNTGYPSYAEGTLSQFPAPVAGTATVKSGELRTKHNNYRYGRYEFRIKAPAFTANGNFINDAFTSRAPWWQQCREVLFDITPANNRASAGTNMVWADNPASYAASGGSYVAEPILVPDGGTIFDDFHVHVFEILPTTVTWFVDGARIRQETGTGTKLPEKSMKIMASLWVFPGSGWGGGLPVNNVYPMHSEIDWIHFYKYDGDDTYPCSPTPSCLPLEDRDYTKNNAEDGLPAAAPW